jgi:hypothetical protein
VSLHHPQAPRRHWFSPAVIAAPILLVAVALAGCPGTLENPEDFNISCGDTVLADRCATSGCHDGTTQAANLNLTRDGLEARVVGVAGSTEPDPNGTGAADCDGLILAVPADPASSLIYRKTVDPPCGSKMPIGAPLNATEQQCLLELIGSFANP